jgi:RNA 3'-terminal phosphate cyclase-like protein
VTVAVARLTVLCSSAQFLRHLKEFFGVTFKIKADPDTGTVMLTCVGVGFMNFSRKVI